ncbi:FAD-dependent oxidoreductase [Mesorhizobium sp. GR13]|uniref:NAD(P)/FAD-dependent oxidoreductase n=1 Tax=Mesorhizobium sp. GR13 TaxID=2562308 RepID=UPI0010C0DE67|nr:FAD-dependent oxidoreductase [Mesorhizobium sp. GR13]
MAIGRSEVAIIGGGVVGLSVAFGLLQAGRRVTVLDGADGDFRASQGNFGLVWLQGKGADFAPYAEWTGDAVAAWPRFAEMVEQISGINLALAQSGGFEFFTNVPELEDFKAALERQQTHLGNRFSYEIVSGDDLRRSFPGIGPGVAGASFCARDGHVNPLRLLRALRGAVSALGGRLITDARVNEIKAAKGGGFDLSLQGGKSHSAERVVLCAGLGITSLAAQLGFVTRVRPQRGELLITEKLADRLPFLSSTIRQVDEGGVQIGGTKAEAGLDDSETLGVMAELARHAVTVFPALADVRVVRAWGALRVLSPDGFPVYARSPRHPGAFLVTCHSGVTLAPLHATTLANWIDDTSNAPDLEAFDENRFTLSDAA